MISEIVSKEDVKEKLSLFRAGGSDGKLVFALGFVDSVNCYVKDISYSFFRIGFCLDEALHNEYFEELGFENISDCAEYYFGFKKSTTYDLINLFRAFCDAKGTWYLPERWRAYSRSQLSVIATVDYYPLKFRDMVSEFDTVSDIKKAKNYWNMVKRGELSSTYIHNNSCKSAKEFVSKCEKNFEEISLSVKKQLEDVAVIVSETSDLVCIEGNSFDFDFDFSERSENLPEIKNIEFSKCSENSDEYKNEFFDKLLECFSDFLIDKCVFPKAEQFMHEFVEEFLIVFRNFLNSNMMDFINYINSDSFRNEYRKFHPKS